MFESILDRCYRLKPPSRTRSPGKPMEILCLGLTGNDTDSLRSALKILGYDSIYHGSTLISRQREDGAFWGPLLNCKFKGQSDFQDVQFDKVLGECQVVMDGPAAIFGEQLITYYPLAKVILNRKQDTSAWYTSMEATYLAIFTFKMWLLSWFDARLYWIWRTFQLVLQGFFENDFEQNGKSYARAHYVNMKDHLKDNKRDYLEWSEKDGWEPLCRYLNKPVPDREFPRSQRAKGDPEEYLTKNIGGLTFIAIRNMILFAGISFVPLYLFRTQLLEGLILLYHLSQSSKIAEYVYPDMEGMEVMPGLHE